MSPLEIGGIVGAALVGGGAVLAFIMRFRPGNNGKRDSDLLREAIKDQTALLQQIRDGIVGLRYELSAHRDKQVAICDSLAALHRRLDGSIPTRSA